MLVNSRDSNLKNSIEIFYPNAKAIENILVDPTNVQSCLDIVSDAGSRVGQLVFNIFKGCLNISFYSLNYSMKAHLFFQIRTPLFFEACETVKDFWFNPHNRSTFEKINAFSNALYVSAQTAETATRMAGVFNVSTPGRDKTVIVTCALSLISLAGNTVLKKIRNEEDLSGALFDITEKTFESMKVIIFLEPEFFKNSPAICTINNVHQTAKYVIDRNIPQLFSNWISRYVSFQFSTWISGYLNPIYEMALFNGRTFYEAVQATYFQNQRTIAPPRSEQYTELL